MSLHLTRDVMRARGIVLRHGWNAMAFQVLNPGIYHWFSESHDGVVGFVKHAGYCMVAGAPTCDAGHIGRVALEFEEAARRAGCRVCYFGAGERMYDDCAEPPTRSVVALGAQPVWLPEQWPEMVSRHASVRAQLHRAVNKGVSVAEWPTNKVTNASASPELADLRRCLNAWLRTRRMPTMHFLVEPDTLSVLEGRRLFVASAPQPGASTEVPVAYLMASPIPARKGWLIEQIVRGAGAPNGTSELLLDQAMRAIAASGSTYATLGLVPLARHVEYESILRNPAWLRLALRGVRIYGRRFFNFDGLEAFKSKFDPAEWEPIYAITNEDSFSPRALYAIAAAFSDRASPVLQVVRALVR